MNIGLFAARSVGYEIAKFFGENQEPLTCLVLDAKDTSHLNSQIVKASKVMPDEVFYSDKLYQKEVLATLKRMDLDLILLTWWPYIIKECVIDIPRLGCLNFHPSYLPYNRGKHYNFWTLVENTPFGVTLHFVDKDIDTGNIAYQSLIEKSWEDTGKSLYYKAQQEIIRLFIEKFTEIKRGLIPRKPQILDQGSFHKSDELEPASQIYLDRTYKARDLLNLIRARTFKPYPGAWFIDDKIKYEVRIEITQRGLIEEEDENVRRTKSVEN